MKKNFNLKNRIKRLDAKRVGLSISLLYQQIQDSARQFQKKVRPKPRTYKNIIYCGMGGSALPADFIRFLYAKYLRVPIITVRGYSMPAYADAQSLVILASYSGTIEEVVSCLKEARKRRLSSFVITSGGILATQAKKFNIPSFIFNPKLNPCKQPRIGIAYIVAGFFMLLKMLQLLRGGAENLIAASARVSSVHEKALSMAQQQYARSFIIVGAEHLSGNAHIMSNQLNESAKTFAPYFLISELDHHLLEGLDGLKAHRTQWTVLFLKSNSYHSQNIKRFEITERVFKKQGFRTESIAFSGSAVEQALTMLDFSSWLSYYVAIMKGVDPSKIPWVDYFKKHL